MMQPFRLSIHVYAMVFFRFGCVIIPHRRRL